MFEQCIPRAPVRPMDEVNVFCVSESLSYSFLISTMLVFFFFLFFVIGQSSTSNFSSCFLCELAWVIIADH